MFTLRCTNGTAFAVVLAHDFDLRSGRVEVKVPDVITGTFSIVCTSYPSMLSPVGVLTDPAVFGDSGNWSQDFTINGVITD